MHHLVAKVAAIALLALGSVAVGAFVMPALHQSEPPPASDELPATEAPAPVAGAAENPAERERSNETPQGAAREHAQPAPRSSVPAGPAAPSLVTGPSAFDIPAVAPRLPSLQGAYALSETIDREIDHLLKSANVPASPLSGDAEFLRRVSLDLTGKVPRRERTVAFLSDNDPTKRAKLIEELLVSKDHGLYFARIWADLLVKRDFDTNRGLKTEAFINWLAGRLNENVGWDQIVRDMITATGQEASAPQTFFVLANQDNRQPSPSKLVGAVGNLFMGIQIQCAECHQHPFTARWNQSDFWGMAAFFGHTKANRTMAKGKPAGPATITEVERQIAPKNKKAAAKVGPTIVGGLRINVPDPNDPRKTVNVATGKFFESTERPNAFHVPYRPHLARWLTASENRYFARAAANRVWAHFFARGLVNPIEDMHDENKPTHPALLRELAKSFTASRYDLKTLIRAICNSQAYQRTSRPLPENTGDERFYSRMAVKVVSAQQLIDSLAVVTGQQAPRVRPGPMARKQPGPGGDPLVRAFDNREYDDEPTEFSYGIPQLLRLMNSGLTAGSARIGTQLAGKHQNDHARAIEEIYLTALSRRPSQRETDRMIAHVSRRGDAAAGYADVLWALLNCAEFVSNH
jgi:hypothetical protein